MNPNRPRHRPDISDQMVKDALTKSGGGIRAAARLLGVNPTSVSKRMLKAGIIQPSANIYATSTLIRGEEGDGFALQWVKEKTAPDNPKLIADAIRDALKGIKPLPRIKKPKVVLADLLSAYVQGDPHLGQYSWSDETGDDYDLVIAEQLHFDAVDRLVLSSPPSKTGLLISVGDTTHGDNSTNRTPASQHALDVDTRFFKVIKVAVRIYERCIQRMLEHHEKVEVVLVPGNHDPHAYVAIVVGLACLYRNNPRVKIEESPAKFVYRRHGNCLIGITHGDTVKLEKLGELMAEDRREDWGQTEFHHWFTGHWHHKKTHEGIGFTAEVMRTLAGKDAYAASHAYRSKRDMQVIVFDKHNGEKERHTVSVRQLTKAAA